mmetsp:Transcript_7869/g.16085  ORF Transcript_7869/g.16085 Transcript_7869/m.16085 type:complete len:200 (-) Transcript_7869:391-990(-)
MARHSCSFTRPRTPFRCGRDVMTESNSRSAAVTLASFGVPKLAVAPITSRSFISLCSTGLWKSLASLSLSHSVRQPATATFWKVARVRRSMEEMSACSSCATPRRHPASGILEVSRSKPCCCSWRTSCASSCSGKSRSTPGSALGSSCSSLRRTDCSLCCFTRWLMKIGSEMDIGCQSRKPARFASIRPDIARPEPTRR